MTNSNVVPVIESNESKNNIKMKFPHYSSGIVVKGFGRGSKQLGIPTANFAENVVEHLPEAYQGGVYYGFAQVDNGPVNRMVMSIGNNPFYNNEKRTMETYIMNVFEKDFYGSNLKTIILGHIRPMANYNSVDELIAAIHKDIMDANEKLELIENQHYINDDFFSTNSHNEK